MNKLTSRKDNLDQLDPGNPVDAKRQQVNTDVWAKIGGAIEGGVQSTGRFANFSARVVSNIAGSISELFGTAGGGTVRVVKKGRRAYKKQTDTAA